jgi:tetratricopeptide (TPR) repeat protein
MVKRSTLCLFLILCAGAALWGQDMILEYTDGFLELQAGSGWQELMIGDSVPADSVVRLADGIAEFSAGSQRIILNQEGVFQLRDLLRASDEVAGWGIGRMVGSRIGALTGEKQERTEAVMGVRGAVQDSDEIEWMDSEGEGDPLARAQALIDEGLYDEAVAAYQEALEASFDPAEKSELSFRIAHAHVLAGRSGQGLRLLAELRPDSGGAWYEDYVLLYGSLLMESLAFKQAAGLFESYLRSGRGGPGEQAVHYLAYFCYAKLGLAENARQALVSAVRLGKDTDLGLQAEKLLLENY